MNKYSQKSNVKQAQVSDKNKLNLDDYYVNIEPEKNNATSPKFVTTYTPKNIRQGKGFRSPKNIGRHCSEDQFKQFKQTKQIQGNKMAYSVNIDELASNDNKNIIMTKSSMLECYNYTEQPYYSYKKVLSPKGNGFSSKNYALNLTQKSKIEQKRASGGRVPKSNFLKETSSTTSAQNSINQKKIPSFFKNKSTKSMNGTTFTKDQFQVIKQLGEGKFGKVFLVKQVKTKFILAMKQVEKEFLIKQSLLNQFIRELKIQAFLDHPGVIKLYGFFSDQQYFYSLMQVGCDGQLYDIISSNRTMSQQATAFISKELLTTINYMHSHKILHRDIKPQNIVLVHGNVKICDFGWAVNKKEELRSTFCGTPLYFSPELLAGNPYDQKVDLWAIGVLCFELYMGCSPFMIEQQADLYRIMEQEVTFPKDKEVSSEFKQFILAILQKDPRKRQSSKQLLQYEFIHHYGQMQTCTQLCN